MGKHVCFLVLEHPFLDARIFKKEARSLVKHGYEVTMIVPRRDGYLFDVDGTLFKENFQQKQFTYKGIKIITYEQIYPEKHLKQLLVNLLSGKSDRFTDQLTQLGLAQKADIYHAHEFYSLYAGVGIKRALSAEGRNIKLIYDSHELEPDPAEKQASNMKKVKLQSLKLMLKETDLVITVSKSIKAWFHSLNEKVPVEVIYNSPPLNPDILPGQGENKELVLAYEGVMNKTRGSFYKLMKILEICNEHFSLTVKLVGGNKKSEPPLPIPAHLEKKVILTGWVDYDSISQAMKGADLGWIDLNSKDFMNHRYAMPNKFFSYLNNGLPVLVNQCQDIGDFIEEYSCGRIVKGLQATAEDYAEALQYLHSNRKEILIMSKNARRVMEEQYSWEYMENKLIALYDKLLQVKRQ